MPELRIANAMTEAISSRSPEQTIALARELALRIQAGDVIALSGDLGSGKTLFTRGFVQSLGYSSLISSPTYTILQTYRIPSITIHHIDLYRLANPDDVDMLDLQQCWQENAITIVEWADRAPRDFFPRSTWYIHIAAGQSEQERIIQITHPAHADNPTNERHQTCSQIT